MPNPLFANHHPYAAVGQIAPMHHQFADTIYYRRNIRSAAARRRSTFIVQLLHLFTLNCCNIIALFIIFLLPQDAGSPFIASAQLSPTPTTPTAIHQLAIKSPSHRRIAIDTIIIPAHCIPDLPDHITTIFTAPLIFYCAHSTDLSPPLSSSGYSIPAIATTHLPSSTPLPFPAHTGSTGSNRQFNPSAATNRIIQSLFTTGNI